MGPNPHIYTDFGQLDDNLMSIQVANYLQALLVLGIQLQSIRLLSGKSRRILRLEE